jgi:hypothetical protein
VVSRRNDYGARGPAQRRGGLASPQARATTGGVARFGKRYEGVGERAGAGARQPVAGEDVPRAPPN